MIADNLKRIEATVPEGVKLVAVSKFHPNEAITEAYEAGMKCFGENRPQEMLEKATTLPMKDLEWHFIGNLQTNKVKIVVPHAVLIHSMSNTRLVEEIDKCAAKIGKVQDVLIELHVAGEETKQGFTPEEALETFTADYVGRFKNIRICGVMGMASNTDDQNRVREDFKAIKACFERLKETTFAGREEFSEVSMGMSGDYLIAIEEGSTIVRVGSAIFGPRQY